MIHTPELGTQATTGSAHSHGASVLLRGVSKAYGTSTVVDDVSLDIRAGEFMTFLGPSGSGKTTTLNMIAGFADVTRGHILLDKEPIERRPPHKRDIGMVFQSYALFPHLTVANNVAFPLRRRRMRKAEIRERVRDTLAMVRLEEFGNRYPNQLSGGQQQRVALARALVFSPRVLLMDEPLGALDKKLREWLQLEIKRLHRELGITFLFVTHDQEEALVLSDRIALFNEGRVEQIGTVDELYLRPATQFAAEFLGESNVLQGAAVGDGQIRTQRGALLRFVSDDPLPRGTDGTVIVRPERVAVLPRGGDADNGLTGRVTQVIYLGMARRLEVDCDGTKMLVREQAGSFSSCGEGDVVRLGWSSADTRLVSR